MITLKYLLIGFFLHCTQEVTAAAIPVYANPDWAQAGALRSATQSDLYAVVDPKDNKLYMKSVALADATSFSLLPGKLAGNYRFLNTKTSLYVSSIGGSSALQATATSWSTYEVFNLTDADSGSFSIAAWNKGWDSTKYIGSSSDGTLTPSLQNTERDQAQRFVWVPKTDTSTISSDHPGYQVKTVVADAPSGAFYAYNVFWAGDLYSNSRAAIMYLPGSGGRTNGVKDAASVLLAAQQDNIGRVLAQSPSSDTVRFLLQNFLLIVPISPVCWDTALNAASASSDCASPANTHSLKHYRPNQLKRIYDTVRDTFGFDTTRFYMMGYSMGARGSLRFGTAYPHLVAAVSVSAGILETTTARYMKPLPYLKTDTGENCWDVMDPNVDGFPCKWPVPATLPLASQYVQTPVRIHSCPGDDTARPEDIKTTCQDIQSAGGSCTIIPSDAPNHNAMESVGADLETLTWLLTNSKAAASA